MDKKMITDAVIAVQNGESSAWTVLDNTYRSEIYRFCLDKVKNPNEAEEITQQTIVTAYEKINSLNNPKRFKPWVLTIANNKCTDYYRRIQKNVSYSSSGDEEDEGVFDNVVESSPELYPEMKLDESTRRRILRKFIYNLPKEQAQCIELKYFQGLKGSEIAAQIGVNANTVRSRLRYGEANLKKQILEYEKSTNSKLFAGLGYSYSNQLSGNTAGRSFRIPAVVAVITALVVAAAAVFGVFMFNGNNNAVRPKNTATGVPGESNGKSQREILDDISGRYLLTSSNDNCRSECVINADGTVNGKYILESNEKKDGFAKTVYESRWNAVVDNLVQLNDYSYSFILADFIYVNEPKTEKIEGDTRTIYLGAKGIDENSSLTVYTPETPVSKLTESITSWPLIERSINGTDKLNAYIIADLSRPEVHPYVLENDKIKKLEPATVSPAVRQTATDPAASGKKH